MIYGSVCSGIEAATIAWEPLGWKAAWFAEINPFCNRVLGARFPNTPNLRDMTQLQQNPIFINSHIDLLVGGTPCQSFSLAGDRKGLDDIRGNLSLEFIKILKNKKPTWFVWENVPGVLSLNEGQDFSFIRNELREAGYGYACGILDARDFGLLQNRPRVFVVGHIGDWVRPYEVLCVRPTRDNDSQRSINAKGRIPTLTLRNAGNGNARGVVVVESPVRREWTTRPDGKEQEWQIRSCTPREEEKRQGFPGDHTNIGGATDQERYEAVGNSMAVPVMRWIGERIQEVNSKEDVMAPFSSEKKKELKAEWETAGKPDFYDFDKKIGPQTAKKYISGWKDAPPPVISTNFSTEEEAKLIEIGREFPSLLQKLGLGVENAPRIIKISN